MPRFTYILPAAIAICWAVCIFLRKDSGKIQMMLATALLVGAAAMGFNDVSVATFIFPFIYLATRSKTSGKSLSKWDCLIFVPSILLIPFTATPAAKIFFYVQVAAISLWAWTAIHRYNKLMAEFYDASSELSADSLGQALLYTVSSVIVLAVAMILPADIRAAAWFPYIPSLFISVLQFLDGYCILQMKEAAKMEEEVAEVIASEETGAIRADAPEAGAAGATVQPGVADKLLQRVIDEQMYLDPNISLVSLAEILNTNRTYLSKRIHDGYGQNFSEFINSLRIKHSIKLLEEAGNNARIKEIALQSGYGNLQSFYRNFSEIMNMTPKQWLSK